MTTHQPYNGFLSREKQTEAELAELEKQRNPQPDGDDGDGEENEDAQDGVKSQEGEKPSSRETDELTAEEQTYKKRYGDLRRFQQQQAKEFKERIEALERQLKENSGNVLPTSKADLEVWVKENPDFYRILRTAIVEETKQTDERLNSLRQEIEAERAQAARDKAEAALLRKHPDLYELQNDPEFHRTVAGMSQWVQSALYDNADDPQAASDALDLVKAKMGRTTKPKEKIGQRKGEPNAADGVPTKSNRSDPPRANGKYKFTESQIARMTSKEFEARFEEIEAARLANEIDWDLSKAAS